MTKKYKIGNSAEAIAVVTQRLMEDSATLNAQKNEALSVFRQTAENLGQINKGLTENAQQYDKLKDFAETQRDSALKAIADNEAVMRKILDIIGE